MLSSLLQMLSCVMPKLKEEIKIIKEEIKKFLSLTPSLAKQCLSSQESWEKPKKKVIAVDGGQMIRKVL